MLRKYGSAPYIAALIHGGPGAKGSLSPCARELGQFYGVLEPIQSEYHINGLVEELNDQIYRCAKAPLTLIGHSWGAWLAVIYAAEHPEIVKNLVLVGCAPFSDSFVSQINSRRLHRLSDPEQVLYRLVLEGLRDLANPDRPYLFEQLQQLTEKSDNFELALKPADTENTLPFDDLMYTQVWPEAAAMRTAGTLERCLDQLDCQVHVIHGAEDPHPLAGVTVLLEKHHVAYACHTLQHCGHTPFLEKYARQPFYDLLLNILQL